MTKVAVTFFTEESARAFVATSPFIGERVEEDLKDPEVLGWFQDPGKAVCEVHFPEGQMGNLQVEGEVRAALGARATIEISAL